MDKVCLELRIIMLQCSLINENLIKVTLLKDKDIIHERVCKLQILTTAFSIKYPKIPKKK